MSFAGSLEDPPQQDKQDDDNVRNYEEVMQKQKQQIPFLRILVLLVLWLILSGCLWNRGQRFEDITTRTPLLKCDYLILGFLGGRDSWNDERQGVRKLALRLRAENFPGVHVETLENKKRRLAIELIQKAFDYDSNGRLDSSEKQSARIVLYGQSFGGAAVVKLARELDELGVPVLLTVQIDSVGKHDAVIPPNVERAANLYQRSGIFIRGEPQIRAQDQASTTIIGNFQFEYGDQKINISNVPWYKKMFRVAHTKMDRDPRVWLKVQELILATVYR